MNFRACLPAVCRLPLLLAVMLAAAGCASFRPGADFPRVASTAFAHPEQTHLGQQAAQLARPRNGDSGFRMLSMGLDGFLTRVEMANAAERSLDLQYFIFRGDESGELVTDALLRAADRGVRVRVLVDDGDSLDGDERLLVLDAHPGVEVRVFNPFAYRGHSAFLRGVEFLLRAGSVDYRMHNKLMVADSAVALTGGRNVGDEYFEINPVSQMADDDLFVAGPMVQDLTKVFDRFWNNPRSIPLRALDRQATSPEVLQKYRQGLAERLAGRASGGLGYAARVATGQPLADMLAGRTLLWAHAQLLFDSPDKEEVEKGERLGRLMNHTVQKAVDEVQSELLMISPYLVPGDEGMRVFHDLKQRGVRVAVLTNSLESNNVPSAQAGYMHYRVPLLQEGVELHELRALPGNAHGSGESRAMTQYGNYSLHAKLFALDRRRVFIGSMNYDQRSMYLNTEMGLLIDSPELAAQAVRRFEAMTSLANAYQPELAPAELPLAQQSLAGGTPADRPRLTWRTEENGQPVVYRSEPARDGWQRIHVNLLRVLPLEGEL